MSTSSTDNLHPDRVDLVLDRATGHLRARRFSLEVISGPDAGRSFRLEGRLRVGTHPDLEVALTDPAVSRLHLELEARPGGVRVGDLGSTNGTLLAGVRVHELFVEQEAVLALGNSKVRIQAAEEDLALLPGQRRFGALRGESERVQRLFAVLERVAPTATTVLILGESGTGKGLVARSIHQASPRAARPFVVVDCRALVPALAESELFGHVQGAFTGAQAPRKGAFLEADGGTVFLDGVGELPAEVQVKLLRALESGSVQRLGESHPRRVDVRILASALPGLRQAVEQGTFRGDLYFRLAVVEVEVPPLRECPEDIPFLARHFLSEMGRPDFELSLELLSRLGAYAWPGNVRELRNVVERAVALGSPVEVKVAATAEPRPILPFKEAKERLLELFVREYLADLQAHCGGNVSEMARTAGVNRGYLYELLERYGLGSPGTDED